MQNATSPAETARRDLWTALTLLAVTAIGFGSLFRNTDLSADFGADPGPGFLPRLLLSALGVCALWLAASSALRLVRAGESPVAAVRRGTLRSFIFPVLLIATLLVYLYAMPRVGFVPATVGFSLLWLLLIGIQEEGRPDLRRLGLYLGEACAITAVIYLVFAKLILVVLP
jgi:hypothetical protein